MLGTALVVTPAAQSRDRPSESLDAPFIAGGQISMDLSAGEYRISASPDNQIHLQWSVRNRSQLRDVEAYADVDGSDATIVMDGPSNNFRVTIAVPVRSDLSIELSAGELSVEDIVGDKDIRLSAGELRIDVGRPDDYSHVEASVWAGELKAPPFGKSREAFSARSTGEARGNTTCGQNSRPVSSICTPSPTKSSRGPSSGNGERASETRPRHALGTVCAPPQ